MIIIIMAIIIIMTITAQIITIIRTNGYNHVIFLHLSNFITISFSKMRIN